MGNATLHARPGTGHSRVYQAYQSHQVCTQCRLFINQSIPVRQTQIQDHRGLHGSIMCTSYMHQELSCYEQEDTIYGGSISGVKGE